MIDGEHYPPVVEAALDDLRLEGHEIGCAVLVGGREKLPAGGAMDLGGIEVVTDDDPRDALLQALTDHRPEAVLDLSDEPVLGYERRFELASISLARGIPYHGADFELRPPPFEDRARKPAMSIIGTGKRTGKTAVAGFAARTLKEAGILPVIVAMGRGGPAEPEVLHGGEVDLTPQDLLEVVESGRHAASDYIEDAILGRVSTVGCRRCGGGLAGAVARSNVPAGVDLANDIDGEIMLLEGSGAAIPPIRVDAAALIMPASIPSHHVDGYLGTFRVLLADVVVVTMCEEPFGSSSQISSLVSRLDDAWRLPDTETGSREGPRVVRTVFRPTPTRSVEGAKVFVATTAPEEAGEQIRQHLIEEHRCEVTGISHSLSDRGKLEEQLEDMGGKADVLLCEIKAAAVDVATKKALAEGLDVVYMDNVPVGVSGDDPAEAFLWAGRKAIERYNARGEVGGEEET